MEMSPQIDIEDDYDHPDESIEYIIECIPCTPAVSEDVDNEFNKLQELYSTLLMNSCFCPHASACGSTFSPFASKSCAHAGNYRTYNHIDETSELVLNRSRPSRDVIFECSSLCTCHAGVCQNRLVQYGPRKYLEIVDSHYLNGQRGLITTKFIPRGGFICEYAGELLTRSEAKRREILLGVTEDSVGIDADDSNVDESIDDLFVYQRKDDESNDDETNGNDNSNDNESNDNDSIDKESNGIPSNELEESESNENGNEDAEVAAAFIQNVDDDNDDDYEDIEDEIDEDKTISSSSMDFERSYNKSKMNYVMCLNEYSFESLRHLTGNKSSSMPSEVDESYDENSVLQPIQTIIDPSQKGNIGRYLNHSCEPNCEILSVRIDCPIPKVAFFAKRNIQPFEELTFHYAGGAKASAAELSGYKNLSLCFCGAKTCQLYLPNLAY